MGTDEAALEAWNLRSVLAGHCDQIRASELGRLARRLPDLAADDLAAVETAIRAVLDRLVLSRLPVDAETARRLATLFPVAFPAAQENPATGPHRPRGERNPTADPGGGPQSLRPTPWH